MEVSDKILMGESAMLFDSLNKYHLINYLRRIPTYTVITSPKVILGDILFSNRHTIDYTLVIAENICRSTERYTHHIDITTQDLMSSISVLRATT